MKLCKIFFMKNYSHFAALIFDCLISAGLLLSLNACPRIGPRAGILTADFAVILA